MEQGFAWKDGPAVDRSSIKGRGTGCNTLLEDYDYLIVRSDGNLYQCVFFMTEGKPIGNVLQQPLEETLRYARELAEYKRLHGRQRPLRRLLSPGRRAARAAAATRTSTRATG